MHKVVIPSYRRADKMQTTKWLTSAEVVVPESQREEYERLNPNIKIIAIPDELDGNVSKKRNAIFDLYKGQKVLIMDDDVHWVGFHEGQAMHKVKEDYFYEFAENMFEMAEELGTIVWGVNLLIDPRMYREFNPISLSNVVLGPLTGWNLVDDTIRYDEKLTLKEDYDICLQVFRKYRKILRNNKWVYFCGHINNQGGILAYRTRDKEKEQMEMLLNKWGSKIVDFDRKTQAGNDTINPIIRVPIKGV